MEEEKSYAGAVESRRVAVKERWLGLWERV
jgi:hypothetical protein